MEVTVGWDDPMPESLRSRWVFHFWKLEQPRGLGFKRLRMPETDISTDARAIVMVDAASEMVVVGVWIGFQHVVTVESMFIKIWKLDSEMIQIIIHIHTCTQIVSQLLSTIESCHHKTCTYKGSCSML